MDVSRMNLLVESAITSDGKPTAEQMMVAELESADIATIMYELCKRGCCSRAYGVYAHLREMGFHLDSTLIHAGIAAAGRALDHHAALRAFADFDQFGVDRTPKTYALVISAMGKCGQWKMALKIFESMTASSVKPDEQCFLSILKTLRLVNQWEIAEQVFGSMPSSGVEQTMQCCHEVLYAFADAKPVPRWEKVIRLLNDMHASGMSPDDRSLGIAVKACVDTLNHPFCRGERVAPPPDENDQPKVSTPPSSPAIIFPKDLLARVD